MNYDLEYFKNSLPKRPKDGHKGTFGHVLNIAGSEFYSGAAYFSSLASLKVGCGKSTLASVNSVVKTVSTLSPDIILMPLSDNKTICEKSISKIKQKLSDFDVISIGCGLSTEKDTIEFFEKFILILPEISKPTIIDADGLNILSQLKNIGLPKNTILTPHPKELSRLLNVKVEEVLKNPEILAKKCSENFNCITVLKLHKTIVTDHNGQIYVNNTGNTALSHGGSGDVLTGIISGLLAQGMECFDAASLGVYLHGLTAEIASNDLTEYSVLASDLMKYIPHAIREII